MTYKVSHYATVGVYLMFKEPKGTIVAFAFAVEEISEGGIEVDIAKVVKAAASRGLTPLSEVEYDAWARELASTKQRQRLQDAIQEHAEARAIDPARLNAILAAHKGPPGGDA